MRFVTTSLTGGVWQGLLRDAGDAPQLTVTLRGETLDAPEMVREDADWRVSFTIPAERISDGVQTFVISDANGTVLDRVAVAAGDALDLDLATEVDLLRAELDLLKKAFRRMGNH